MAHRKNRYKRLLKPKELGLATLKSYQKQDIPLNRQQWISHSGKRQKIKYLRQACHDILSSTDPQTVEILKRAKEIIAGKFEEYGMLMMVFQAKEMSDSTGLPFVDTLDYVIDKIKSDIDKEAKNGEATSNNPSQ